MAARKSLLSAAIPPAPKAEVKAPAPVQAPGEAPTLSALAKRVNPNKGKYHLGGYYDMDHPVIEEFRILATRLRIAQSDLMLEAIEDLNAKYAANAAFTRKRA